MKDYIDYELWVNLNGDDQNIRVLTKDEKNDVILFLHGGPAESDRYAVIPNQKQLIYNNYTMVVWDQRGAGKSFKAPLTELRAETIVKDAISLVEFLCNKFNKEKIIIAGHSWGTYIGTSLVTRIPEKIKAYIITGMMVECKEAEEISYNYVMEKAIEDKNTKLIEVLKDHKPVNGKYDDVKYLMMQRKALLKYHGNMYKESVSTIGTILSLLKCYSIKEVFGYMKALSTLPTQLIDDAFSADFTNVTELSMPVLLTIGKHDYCTPFQLAERWYNNLTAPKKQLVYFEESGHSPIHEEKDKWNEVVIEFLKSL